MSNTSPHTTPSRVSLSRLGVLANSLPDAPTKSALIWSAIRNKMFGFVPAEATPFSSNKPKTATNAINIRTHSLDCQTYCARTIFRSGIQVLFLFVSLLSRARKADYSYRENCLLSPESVNFCFLNIRDFSSDLRFLYPAPNPVRGPWLRIRDPLLLWTAELRNKNSVWIPQVIYNVRVRNHLLRLTLGGTVNPKAFATCCKSNLSTLKHCLCECDAYACR